MRKTTTYRCLTKWIMLSALMAISLNAQAAVRLGRLAQRKSAPVVRQPQRSVPQTQRWPAPVERRPPAPALNQQRVVSPQIQPSQQGGRFQPEARVAPKGHLAQWMNQHSSLSLSQQESALQREPGFRELPQTTQQRLQNRLIELNAMPPEKRQRLLRQNEWMEHLSPDQRAQVRGATEQLGALPPDQRRSVAQSFRALRSLPPDERMAALNSERYLGQLNPAQINSLRNLIRVEPMMPPPDIRP